MICFRVDSNKTIASGHVMRCLSIANVLKERKQNILFINADSNSDEMIETAGFKHLSLHSKWDNLDSEIPKMIKHLKNNKCDLLIIDTYSITKNYVEALRPYVKICYLGSKQENLGKLNVLINYSSHIDYDFYSNNYKDTFLMLGTDYIPLRKEFQNLHYRPLTGKLRNVLLTTGNTDGNCFTAKLINYFSKLEEFSQLDFNVIIGRMFINKDEIQALAQKYKNIHLYENVKNMKEIIQKCDVAISANGTTVFELAACSVPAITFAMVPEQVESAETLNKMGIVSYCGRFYEDEIQCILTITKKLKEFFFNFEELNTFSKNAKNLVDGNGCIRIVDNLLNIISKGDLC